MARCNRCYGHFYGPPAFFPSLCDDCGPESKSVIEAAESIGRGLAVDHEGTSSYAERLVELVREASKRTDEEKAAPDLLEALRELADLVDAIRNGEYKPDSFTTQPARAAIAKAEGSANA